MRKPPRGRKSPIILVLDQHTDTAELYALALHAAGFRVECATFQPPPALGPVPDLVIAHERQPDISEVRRLLGGRTVPTILLAGWLEKGTTAAAVGCDVLLQIPVSPAALVETVCSLIGRPVAA